MLRGQGLSGVFACGVCVCVCVSAVEVSGQACIPFFLFEAYWFWGFWVGRPGLVPVGVGQGVNTSGEEAPVIWEAADAITGSYLPSQGVKDICSGSLP